MLENSTSAHIKTHIFFLFDKDDAYGPYQSVSVPVESSLNFRSSHPFGLF